MAGERAVEGAGPLPDIDESGVDLAQIRRMLDLAPAERLTFVAEFMASLLAARGVDDDGRPG
jgi:hypothetical protein